MKTTVYKASDLTNTHTINHINQVIHTHGLVVFPTETVYGIGASALDAIASAKIYTVKGRPSDNPLIVHIADLDALKTIVRDVPKDADTLIRAFWPGALTLVFNKQPHIPDAITGGLDTVAVRMPSNTVARDVINAAQTPLCAPSANISGRPSSTLFDHVYADLKDKVDIIIDGGKSLIGIESTVLDMTSAVPTLLRPGAITKAMIEDVLKTKILDLSERDATDVPKSPGMKYKHYAPKGKITVLYGEERKVAEFIQSTLKKLNHDKVAVLCATGFCAYFDDSVTFDMGTTEEEIGANLFIALRKMDDLGIEHILTPAFNENALGYATMNRLLKAAGYNIIKL